MELRGVRVDGDPGEQEVCPRRAIAALIAVAGFALAFRDLS